ncbi:hypothetical protein [Cellulomonas fimi]|uniref:Uncharacterized protein n=1 Tax=Cellulomonas fimi TaxID=1708 RepID=A0A7Y0LYZ1_CELFI|nr:hypothetical protein [Cellulomonas fimi]NMR20529.1 hypothetical protein [Cellulomonas fimi]
MDLDGTMAAEISIPTGVDVLSIVYSAASKSVYLAANDSAAAHLYRWGGGSTLTKVGTIPGQYAVRLAPAPDGDLYIGTYAPSNGRLYVLADGAVRALGQPIPGESYVRSLAVDETNVWLSNYAEASAKLVKVDRATGRATVVTTPAAFGAQWSAFDMSRAGDFLFLRMVNQPYLFAYNVSTGAFENFDDQVGRLTGGTETPNVVPYIEGISPYGISPLIEGRYVYFQRSGAGLMRVDLANHLKTVRVDKYNAKDNPKPWPSSSVAGPVSYAWLDGVAGRSGFSLVTTTIDGKVVINSAGQTSPVVKTLRATDAPSTIMSLGTDAAGAIYSGGYDLPSGIGRHVPGGGGTALLPGPQIEGFGAFDDAVVMGGYTGNSSASAPIYLYDGASNPALRLHLNNSQERPVAIRQVGRQVAIGSVPIKNTLGGAMSLWNPATNALTVKRNIIPNHSVISLAAHGDIVVGGSSNTGGTGAVPAASPAEIFTYNVTTGAVKRFTPPGASSATYSWVAAITPDPSQQGHFWAISTGFLIQFRVGADGSMTLTRNLGGYPNTSSPTGKELGIAFVNGTLFATLGQELAAVNTTTGERTTVAGKNDAGPVTALVQDGDDLYFARGARLYRYEVSSAETATALQAPLVTSPDLSATQAPGSFVFSGTGTRNSTITLSDGSRTRSTVVMDGGAWTLGAIDFAAGSYDLTFTATLDGQPARVTRAVLTTTGQSSYTCTLPAPTPDNVVVGGYNEPNREYAFRGTGGKPGSVITVVSGTRKRSATVRDDGTWATSPLWMGWWAGAVPFTASGAGCASATNNVSLTFATKPTSHVRPLLISHNSTSFYPGGEVGFSGKGTPGAMITLQAGSQVRYAAVSSTGRWHLRTIAVSPSPMTFTFLSQVPGYADQSTSVDVYFGEAPTALSAPIVMSHGSGDTVAAGPVVITGRGTPNSKVVLTVGGKTYSTFVRGSGRWDLPAIPLTAGAHRLTLSASAPGFTALTSRLDLVAS